jgi:1,4-alpha-glucan branching enzyme
MTSLRALYGYMYAHPGKKLMFMGCEFGQGREWNENRSLDWHLLDDPLHGGLKRFVADLNRVYGSEPALHEMDFDSAGFQWIDCNDHENSVISFLRRSAAGDVVLAVLNFTPVPRDGYRIGVPASGAFEEIVNSDSQTYGGSNVGNAGVVFSEPIAAHGHIDSLRLNLPPLGFLLLKQAAAADE